MQNARQILGAGLERSTGLPCWRAPVDRLGVDSGPGLAGIVNSPSDGPKTAQKSKQKAAQELTIV